MKAYSVDLRKKIVEAYHVQKAGSQREVAQIFGIARSTVQKYLKLNKEKKSLEPRHGGGKPPIIDESNLKIVEKLQLANKEATLLELSALLEKETGIKASEQVLCRALQKLNLTTKKNKSRRTTKNRKSKKR